MWRFVFTALFLCGIYTLEIHEENILLFFYSPGNNDTKTSVPLNRSEFIPWKLNTSTDIKVIIHGYLSNSKSPLTQQIINSYLISGEHNNILFFDWGKYGFANSYFDTFFAKEQIAEIIAKDLIRFSEVNKIPLSKFHVLGMFFGGQLAGLVGQRVYNKTNTKLPRITGLDPVGPLFLGAPKNSRLDSSDATFVDIIHTSLFTGYFQPCGTVDFWPNGGKIQRGCEIFDMCNQNRAVEYYIESINSQNFTAWECFNEQLFDQGMCEEGDCIVMGEHVNTSAKGQYFLHTRSKSPYACNC